MKLSEIFRKVKDFHKGMAAKFVPGLYASVLGIIISLSLAAWINHRQTSAGIRQALILVQEELADNFKEAESMYERIRLEKRADSYFASLGDRLDAISKDSVKIYGPAAYANLPYYFVTDAFAALRDSGLLSKISDIKLVMHLTGAYRAVSIMQQSYDAYLSKKSSLRDAVLSGKLEKMQLGPATSTDFWTAFLSSPEGRFFVRDLPNMQASKIYENQLKTMENTLLSLEKTLEK